MADTYVSTTNSNFKKILRNAEEIGIDTLDKARGFLIKTLKILGLENEFIVYNL